MGAYVRCIDRRCACGKVARQEVFNALNSSLGVYCGVCARRLIRRLNVDEAESINEAEETAGV